jgi:hypothetical protein
VADARVRIRRGKCGCVVEAERVADTTPLGDEVVTATEAARLMGERCKH